jgi:uncharacterized membrane protein YbaN (DUF454 family)
MRILLVSIGCLSLALGIVGIFLPLLPTTPFLILAAICFSKASPRLHQWLIHHPRLGPSIVAWQTRRVIPLKAKLLATLLLVPTILFATIVGERPLWARAVMLSVAAGVMIFIWTKKSK